jgi:hypothetical protein
MVTCKLKILQFCKSIAIDHGIGSHIALTGPKMAPKDVRRIPGTLVEVRAVVFMALSECARQHGSNKTTKILKGRVLSSEKVPTSSGKTTQTLVTVQINLGGGDKKITTVVRNVKAVMVENLAMNQGGCTSMGSTHFGASDLQDADGSPQEAPGPNRSYQGSSIPISGTIVTGELADSSNGSGEKNHRSTNTAAMAVEIDAAQWPTPAVVVYDTAWYVDDDATMMIPINGAFPKNNWYVTNSINVPFGVGSDQEGHLSCLDYFLMMYLREKINSMVQLTNAQLWVHHKKEMSKGELICFFGMMVLVTEFQFNGRNLALISLVLQSLVRRLASLIITLMIYGDTSSGAISQGRSQMGCPGRSTDGCWWITIMTQDSMTTRRDTLSPQSASVLMSLWLVGMVKEVTGSTWVFQCMFAIDRKPESGCEIQNVACGKSGVMIRLKLVKTAEEEASNHQEDHQDHLPPEAKVLKSLVLPGSTSVTQITVFFISKWSKWSQGEGLGYPYD